MYVPQLGSRFDWTLVSLKLRQSPCCYALYLGNTTSTMYSPGNRIVMDVTYRVLKYIYTNLNNIRVLHIDPFPISARHPFQDASDTPHNSSSALSACHHQHRLTWHIIQCPFPVRSQALCCRCWISPRNITPCCSLPSLCQDQASIASSSHTRYSRVLRHSIDTQISQ